MDYFQILCAIAVLFLSVYYYYFSLYNSWKVRGIAGPRPKPLVGNLMNMLLKKVSISDQLKQWYDEYKHEPVIVVFQGGTPVVLVNDLDLVKDVIIKDFSLFANRGFLTFPKIEPLGENLFLLEAERWRPLRMKLSPIFTSGKLREMFPLVVECSKNLEKYLSKVEEADGPIDCRELAAKFTTDVIGSCVFGININALSDEECEFRRMGRKFFLPTFKVHVRNSCRQISPFLYEIFGGMLQDHDVDEFFINMIKDTIEYRTENNVIRPDFVHMLMELQKKPEKIDNIELTNQLLAAQAFVFFNAGFETSSTTIANALYELAQQQDVQDKLRQEIRDSFAEHDGVLIYEQIKSMNYLDKVFKETLRKYPVLAMLPRQSMANYKFNGTKITVPKGTKVWVPVCAIQRDPNYYPNPDVFDPERFNEDAVAARHPMAYLPFGDGPRNCIGARFANYQSKVALITILRNYKVEVCGKTVIPYKSDPTSFLLTLKGGVYLRIAKV